ncbi:Acyltransferase-like protein, chloroplastic [Heracleum sosnowskyi]|uniref:Acyltransferase-like protein, chloroplastic n=1 Tax=Heracleum sosnowskyi TaxID=360622 RepID=A0AAD8M435_9APIA|nr:Acyltransferase-like protein, chloroplastic [Heracleum sosnowskyi]
MAAEVSVVPASGYYPVRILNALPTATTFRQKRKQFISATINNTRRGNTRSSMSKKAGDKNEEEMERRSFKDYLEHSKDLVRSSDAGPPRWFSPLECSATLKNSPLLLSLPGLDGNGLGLSLQYQRLGQIFDIWCLHIPIDDRTPFPELVKLVERTVRSENHRLPNRPIYLIGESFGGCIALAVASCNPDIDLVLILANPATSFRESQFQPLIPPLEVMPDNLHIGVPYLLSLMTDSPTKLVIAALEKGLSPQQTVGEMSQGAMALSSYLSVMSDVLSAKSLLWKLKLVTSACAFANSRLHAVKAQTLILSSGKDHLLPSREEADRLKKILPICEIRRFNDSGHALFLESAIDLVTIIMGSSFYRRQRYLDYASDYFPPSPSEFKKLYETTSFIEKFTSPVMLSTLENGKIVRSLAGIPYKGPVILVGYHMMVGLELAPLTSRFWIDGDIHLRAIAHPFLFKKLKEENMLDISAFDIVRVMGAVPVSPTNLYRLLSLNSHVLLYPGGVREAFHRKGEEYKLFWPEQSEFIRMAARFGAKIIPFGVVGEDDVSQLLLDYDDQVKIPFLQSYNKEFNESFTKLRADSEGEVAKQDLHLPILLPKVPGRFYFLFGKPIETEGRKQELMTREKSQELYREVKSEVENCLAYLKEKRENDPYRSILARQVYQAIHGPDAEVPTFSL